MLIGALLTAITLGAPFSDGAVLQRGMKVPVWGKADAGENVTVEFAGQVKKSVAAADGSWRVDLDPLETSAEGRELKVNDKVVKDVLVGEVWFASGQSNMECPIWSKNTRYRDMKGGFMTKMTRLPLIRYVKMSHRWSTNVVDRTAKWCAFTPETLAPEYNGGGNYLSAVAFYYARELHLALGIPVGILDASWGGTNIDAWTPRCGYDDCNPSIKATADYIVKNQADWDSSKANKKGAISGAYQQPTVLWNGMVGAFAPMAMRGFIWYQGCHNNDEHRLYNAKLHALYNGWSRSFENPGLRMYLAELAPWKINWQGICAAQEKFVDEQKNAALAVTADVGNFDDIHPNDKEIVAKRLVLHALKRDYGFDIPQDNSPRFRSVEFADGKAKVSFDNVESWYVYAPKQTHNAPFEVAGTNGVWQTAKIVNFRKQKDSKGKDFDTDFIDGPVIEVASDKVSEPVKVRYMVKNHTSSILYNEAALPLGIFESK